MIDEITRLDDGIRVRFSGAVSSNELQEACVECIRQLKVQPYRYQIFCFQNIEDISLSMRQLQMIALHDASAFKEHGVKRVATVSSSELVNGLGLAYASFVRAGDVESAIFEDLAGAEEWVNEAV